MTVLVTGGAGFIGTALGRRLRELGDDVVVLDNLHPQVHGPDPAPPHDVDFVRGDVTSPEDLAAIVARLRPATVVHLAAETGTGQSLDESARHAAVNVLGTARLVDACTAAGHVPEHLLLASSRAVYGEGRWRAADGSLHYPAPRTHAALAAGRWTPALPVDGPAEPLPHDAATTEPRPTSVYAATKLAQEHLLGAWCAARGSRLSVLRLQNVYGPGQALGNPYTGVIAFFVRVAAAGAQLDVYEDGAIVRDFVYVDDAVAALVAALRRTDADPTPLDIGSGSAVTVHEVAATVTALLGAPEPAVTGAFRDGDVRAASADISRARAVLGWSPTWSLTDGLTALLHWMREGAEPA